MGRQIFATGCLQAIASWIDLLKLSFVAALKALTAFERQRWGKSGR